MINLYVGVTHNGLAYLLAGPCGFGLLAGAANRVLGTDGQRHCSMERLHSSLTPRLHRLESHHVTSQTDKLRQLLDASGMGRCLDELAAQIAERWKDKSRLALVGVYRRGVPFARQLANRLEAMGKQVDFGKIDITQYRDDLQTMKVVPQLRGSEIDFDMDDAVVILCDEVIYTARTTRAALEELLDFGRARCVQIAVLVDRSGRELPIHPDYTGIKVDLPLQERVSVRFAEHDGWDEVFVRHWEGRPA